MATVAEILKDHEARIAALEARPTTSEWDQEVDLGTPVPVADTLDALKAKLPELSGDDLVAAEARVRILEDEAREVKTVEEPKTMVDVVAKDEKGEWVVDLPEVDEGIQAARREFASKHLKFYDEFGTDQGSVMVQAYGKGGPIWLYHYDRDFCLQLARPLRVGMLEDVARIDANLAAEMGRDLLMDRTADEDGRARQTDYLLSQSG